MVEQLCAYSILAWLCPVGPLVLIGVGMQFGKYGVRATLTRWLLSVFPTPMEGGETHDRPT